MARASAREFAEFNGLLASILDRGLPLEASMDLLAAQARSPGFRAAVDALHARLREGAALPDAMATRPEAFSEDYRALVKAGLDAGRLAPTLRHVASYESLRDRLTRKARRLFIYVATGFALSLIVLGILLFFGRGFGEAVRGLEGVDYSEGWTRAEKFVIIPRETQWFVLAMLGFLGTGLVAFLLFRWLSGTRLGYSMPAWGRLQKSRDLALFSTVMALRLGSGRPLPESILAAAKSLPTPYGRQVLGEVGGRVDEGHDLSSALFYGRFFPRTLTWAVSLGERRGDLPAVFHSFSGIYAAELERDFEVLFLLATPVGLIVLGNLALFAAMAVLSPMYRLMTVLGGV